MGRLRHHRTRSAVKHGSSKMASEKDLLEAFQKGKKSGSSAAYAKMRKDKPKRRKKYYRMKKFGSSTKQAIGRFQSKHPYLAGAAEGAVILGGSAAVVREVTGNELVFERLQFLHRIPVIGGIYRLAVDATRSVAQRLLRG